MGSHSDFLQRVRRYSSVRSTRSNMKRVLSLKVFAAMLLLSACVTINVYFPAAAAEKAADKIIEDVWGGTPQGSSKPDKRSDLHELEQPRMLLAAAGAVLDLIIPAAEAQTADLNIATPAVRQLTQS